MKKLLPTLMFCFVTSIVCAQNSTKLVKASIVYPSPGNSGQNIIKDGQRFLCGNSYFKKTGDNSWGEFKLFSQNPLFNFSVIENTPTYKILYDASRKTYVKLTYNEGFWGYNLDNISTKLGNGFWTEVK